MRECRRADKPPLPSPWRKASESPYLKEKTPDLYKGFSALKDSKAYEFQVGYVYEIQYIPGDSMEDFIHEDFDLTDWKQYSLYLYPEKSLIRRIK